MNTLAEQIRQQARDLMLVADEIERGGIVTTKAHFGLGDRRAEVVFLTVCRAMRVDPNVVLSRSRLQFVCEARFAVVWALRHLLGLRYINIGAIIRRDHGAAVAAEARVREWLAVDPHYRSRLEAAVELAKSELAKAEGTPC